MFNKIFSAGLYLRLSREDEDTHADASESIKNQRKIIEQFIEKQDNISIFDYYIDDGKSGTDFNRPGFKRMLQDIYMRKIDCVIVKDLSRLGRNYIEVGNYTEYIFPTYEIRFIAVNDNIDSYKDPDSINNIIVPFKNLINEEYVRDVSNKVKAVSEVQKRKGYHQSPIPPYGYIKDPNDWHHLIVDKEAAKIVKEIFKRRLEGDTLRNITNDLNERNVKTIWQILYKDNPKYKDRYWRNSYISKILRNQMYCGDMVRNKSYQLNYKIHKKMERDKSEWIIVKNTHEAIIDRNTFDKVQETFSHGEKKIQHRRKNIYLGYVYCAHCHKRMRTNYTYCDNEYKISSFTCVTGDDRKKLCTHHHITIEDFEKQVKKICRRKVKYLLQKNNEIILNIQDSSKKVQDLETQIEKLKQDLDGLLGIKSIFINDFAMGKISQQDLNVFNESQSVKINSINKKINDLRKSKFDIENKISQAKENIEFLNKHKKIKVIDKELLDDLIDKIEVDIDNKVKVYFKIEKEEE